MNVALPVVMFLMGIAAGGAAVWFLMRKVADERAKDKDATVADLRTSLSEKDRLLEERAKNIADLTKDKAVLQTSLDNERENINERIKLLNEAEKQFKDVFRALAVDALENNTKKFDALYSKPVTTTLEDIKTKIALVDNSATSLKAETSKLVKALRKPDVRGQWGEMHLERVLEITGMSERCDYCTQQVIGDEDNRQRPDVIVRLPGQKQLAVDAKATLQAFLDLADAPDDETRQANLQDFIGHVRDRIKILGSKAYHQNIDGSPEFVVLFLPTEGLFSTALTLDPELLEFADSKRVLLAGPMNLIALLRAVAHGWKQDDMANNAREICRDAEDLYKRLSTFGGHMVDLGKSLNNSVAAYDSAVGSLDRMVMPMARKFEMHGAAPADKRLPELPPIEKTTRLLQSDEFRLDSSDGRPEDQESLSRPR